VICKECGTVFCWDEAAEAGGERREYCSRKCKRTSQARRRGHRHLTEEQRAKMAACAANGKVGYPGPVAAARAAAEIAARKGHDYRPLTPYRCPCGWWHLTKAKAKLKYLDRLAKIPGGTEALLILPPAASR